MDPVYLDVCCVNRPFDDQAQERIRLETEAVVLILARIQRSELRWINGEAVEIELAQGPSGARRTSVEQLLALANQRVGIAAEEVSRAQELTSLGFRPMDALHIACAEGGGADVLLTTDDAFLRVARRAFAQLRVAVRNPLEWLAEVIRR